MACNRRGVRDRYDLVKVASVKSSPAGGRGDESGAFAYGANRLDVRFENDDRLARHFEVVVLGSRVRLRELTIQGEAGVIGKLDPEGFTRVPVDTPLGRALLGRRVGDKVLVCTRGKIATLEILAVQ
jgi:hypothetical protein